MTAIRLLALTLWVAGAFLMGCGDAEESETVTETAGQTAEASQTTTTETAGIKSTITDPEAAAAGARRHGPRYFETPSHNIGCYVSAKAARCDIRKRDWSPPAEPASCRKIGLDYGQGIVVGTTHAEFVCAGDTVLGGRATLGYGETAMRGPLVCESDRKGLTCHHREHGHGFFLSRQRYRIF
jgi:hypothetical protein